MTRARKGLVGLSVRDVGAGAVQDERVITTLTEHPTARALSADEWGPPRLFPGTTVTIVSEIGTPILLTTTDRTVTVRTIMITLTGSIDLDSPVIHRKRGRTLARSALH